MAAKMPAKTPGGKKPAAKKPAAERVAAKKTTKTEEIDLLPFLELEGEDKAILEKIKLIVDGKISAHLSEALGIFDIIIPKTYCYNVDGQLQLDVNGNPAQDWDKITPADIKTVLLKIPIVQMSISSIEVDSWAEAEMAKILQKEDKTPQAAYRAFFLKYANKRINTLNEGLSKIVDRWSRAVELIKAEIHTNQSANRF